MRWGVGRRACHISDVEEWVLFSFMWVPRVELGCQPCAAGAFTLIAQRTFLIQWILRLKKQKNLPFFVETKWCMFGRTMLGS